MHWIDRCELNQMIADSKGGIEIKKSITGRIQEFLEEFANHYYEQDSFVVACQIAQMTTDQRRFTCQLCGATYIEVSECQFGHDDFICPRCGQEALIEDKPPKILEHEIT